jgi:hypothetical protein
MCGNRRWRRLSGMLEGGWGRLAAVGRPEVAAPALAGTVGTALAPVRAFAPFIAEPRAGSCPTDRREAPQGHKYQDTADGPRGKRTTVRRRDVLSDLGIRAMWGRGDLGERTLGRSVRAAIEAQGVGARRWRAAPAARLGARGAA